MELTSPEVYRISRRLLSTSQDILVGWSVGRLEQAIEVLEETERGASETAFHHRGMHYRSVSLSSEVKIRRIDHGAHVARGNFDFGAERDGPVVHTAVVEGRF
jgi:hypothetical protein